MSSTAALLLISLVSLAYGQQSLRDKDCEGRVEGSTVEQGKYYYLCVDGALKQAGCLSPANERIPIDGTFRQNDYLMRCALSAQGYLSIDYSACVHAGKTVYPGESYEADGVWMSCDKQDFFIVEHVRGCVRNGQRLNKGERVRDGDALLECRDQGATVALKPVGCVLDTREFLIGETITDENLWYQCSESGGKVKRQAIGCVKNGKTLYDGEAYHQEEVIYRCHVTSKDTKGARHEAVGCIVKDGDVDVGKSFGCQWRSGAEPSRFTYECQYLRGTAVKVKVNCFYELPNAQHLLEAGCFRTVGDRAIGCKNTTEGVEYVYFDANQLDIAAQNKLRVC